MRKEDIQEEIRVRTPKKGEIFGVVIGNLGGSRMRVECSDGKERVCRIPGRLKRRIWVREGDVVLVVPLEIEGDKKGEIVYRYKQTHIKWLKENGFLKK